MNSFDETEAKWADAAVRNIVKGRKKCSKCDGSGSIGHSHNGLLIKVDICNNCYGHGDIPVYDWLDYLLRRPKLRKDYKNYNEKKVKK